MSCVRPATTDDLAALGPIEDAADLRFASILGPDRWGSAPSGAERAAQPGFLLVAGKPVIGFAHVLVIGAAAHLEQVSVHPDAGRRGVGAALVEAAWQETVRRGFTELTLMTFADVPWNAPFYERIGFVRTEPDAPHLIRLQAREHELGLGDLGTRVAMRRSAPRANHGDPL